MELITGGTGIVGGHLLLERAIAGERVRALHRPGSDRSIVERVFRHYRDDADDLLQRIEWVPGDVLDISLLKDAMEGVHHVYHSAALVSFDPKDTAALHRVNVEGTANVVNTAILMGARRLCHVSSTATIGHAPEGQERHEGPPWTQGPHTSPYAASKFAAELEVYRGMAEGLDAVIVNPCVVLGPGAPGRSTMTLVERLRRGTSFHPPGSNAVVDARDVAACMVRLMAEGLSGERYLLVGENVSYRALFAALAESFGKRAPHRTVPGWALGMAWRLERLRTLFGGRAFITRHTVHSAIVRRSFSNTKVRAVLGYDFRSAREAAANVAAFVERRRL